MVLRLAGTIHGYHFILPFSFILCHETPFHHFKTPTCIAKSIYHLIVDRHAGLSGIWMSIRRGRGRVGCLRPRERPSDGMPSTTPPGGRLWQTTTPTIGRSLRPVVGMQTAAQPSRLPNQPPGRPLGTKPLQNQVVR
jgi:hypothetical protein